jgi:hypothetical protein
MCGDFSFKEDFLEKMSAFYRKMSAKTGLILVR